MSSENLFQFACSSEAETTTLAAAFSRFLGRGDTVLLSGPVGAGKSHFARGVITAILARCGLAEDIPSPTYTLVQTYEVPELEIWHADLYRLTETGEIHELGLIDAFSRTLCLVEWPDKLGIDTPENALSIEFQSDFVDADRRVLNCRSTGSKWRWMSELGTSNG